VLYVLIDSIVSTAANRLYVLHSTHTACILMHVIVCILCANVLLQSLRLLYNRQKRVTSSKPNYVHAAISGAVAGAVSEVVAHQSGIMPRLTRETGIISQQSIIAAVQGVFYGVCWERCTTTMNEQATPAAK
jgi:hypothetical protein